MQALNVNIELSNFNVWSMYVADITASEFSERICKANPDEVLLLKTKLSLQ
jgi:hypothetical protein